MDENQHIWSDWARTLQRLGIKDAVASLLETAGSLTVLLAQVLYLGQPLLSAAFSPRSLDMLAQVLENPVNRREFVTFLREASTSGSSA